MPRWVPYIRTYRPVPLTSSVWVPPVPVVVVWIGVQLLPSADVWIWKDLPYAPSHCSTT